MGSLRLVLALLVVYFHAQAYTVYVLGGEPFATLLPVPDGRSAVQMFYLISGFYMALVLNTKYRTADANWTFYTNRFLRLWPAVVVVNLLVALSFLAIGEVRLFNFTTGIGEFLAMLGSLDAGALAFLAFTNLFIVGQDLVFFLRFDPGGVSFAPFGTEGHNGSSLLLNHPLFTVAIEIFYYAISPFVLRRGWRAAAGFVVLGGLYHVLVFVTGASSLIWGYHFFASAAYFYFLGALAFHLYRWLEEEPRRGWLAARPALAWGFVTAGLLLLLPIYWLMPRNTLFMAPVLALVVPVLFSLSRQNQADRMVGELSFGVYLTHIPILFLIGPLVGPLDLWLWTSALATGSAVLLFLLLEQPIDRWRQRRAAAARTHGRKATAAGWRQPRRAAAGGG
jgi:peptidoglycan/LPS O-acetylase OafA/YrhL